jgi:hypothetical protein
MIVVRTILQAKFGKGGELAAHMAEDNQRIIGEIGQQGNQGGRWRILTDLTGQFDTVVLEVEVESMAAWEQARAKLFSSPAFQQSMAQTQQLVVGGRNEMWNIEGQG